MFIILTIIAAIFVVGFILEAICDAPRVKAERAQAEREFQEREQKRELALAQFVADPNSSVTFYSSDRFPPVADSDRFEWKDRALAAKAWAAHHPEEAARRKAKAVAEHAEYQARTAQREAQEAAERAAELERVAPALATLRTVGLGAV